MPIRYTAIVFTNGDVDDFWDVKSFPKKTLAGETPDTASYDFTLRPSRSLRGAATRPGSPPWSPMPIAGRATSR
ncbi:MAG: hypothetical protein WDN03_19915 [Rhizomicrobium sp.]